MKKTGEICYRLHQQHQQERTSGCRKQTSLAHERAEHLKKILTSVGIEPTPIESHTIYDVAVDPFSKNSMQR